MNCYTHRQTSAVGVCAVCQKGICRDCVGADTPRLVCKDCVARSAIIGFEYRSATTVGSWPLVHVCMGIDPVTMRPRVAKGVVAIGNIAFGALAFGGASIGLVAFGGAAFGVLLAVAGVAVGVGLSLGGVAIGSVAVGGVAIGFAYAFGGVAIGPAAIGAQRCDEAARDFFMRWLGSGRIPPVCR